MVDSELLGIVAGMEWARQRASKSGLANATPTGRSVCRRTSTTCSLHFTCTSLIPCLLDAVRVADRRPRMPRSSVSLSPRCSLIARAIGGFSPSPAGGSRPSFRPPPTPPPPPGSAPSPPPPPYFWGFRLYILCPPDGMPFAFELAAANQPERLAAAELLQRARRPGPTSTAD